MQAPGNFCFAETSGIEPFDTAGLPPCDWGSTMRTAFLAVPRSSDASQLAAVSLQGHPRPRDLIAVKVVNVFDANVRQWSVQRTGEVQNGYSGDEAHRSFTHCGTAG